MLPSILETFLKWSKKVGVDLEATDKEGRTPLHYLYMHQRNKKLVGKFIEAAKKTYNIEFNVDARDHYDKKPIQC